jgi:hypothetical protein
MSKPESGQEGVAAGGPPVKPENYEIMLGKPKARTGAPAFAKPPDKPHKPAKTGVGDGGVRETVETIVFVVVLVLLLKTFLAEAFVIPTGSMATTLYGYHLEMPCAQCGYPCPVNASNEDGDPKVRGFFCVNCQYYNDLRGGEK